LRAHLAATLPEHMIPAAFVVLDAFPLTPNGKLDLKALPAPDLDRTALSAGYVAPRTPTEATLADIWSSVLGVETVGVQDNFFELGGDSILTIQVVSRAARAGLHLTPRYLFERPTIAALAVVAAPGAELAASDGSLRRASERRSTGTRRYAWRYRQAGQPR
jgi:aryl carrier-like protein